MRSLSKTKTSGKESASKVLSIDKLTDAQKELMKCTVGLGLWEQILEGQPIPSSVIKLVKGKLEYNNLLPQRLWWKED